MERIVGRLGHHPDRPERFAIIDPNGKPLGWWGIDQSRAEIAAIIAMSSYTLHDDDVVTETVK